MDGVKRATLLGMPMHAVTAVYGTEGLRARFLYEIEVFDADQQDMLRRAERIASRLHADDHRVREPYINHPLRVTIRVLHHYRVRDVDVIAAALLHDAVEDHPQEIADYASDDERVADTTAAAVVVLARAFTTRVANLIQAVTNPTYDTSRDKHEQYREHVTASLERSPWARVIKLSDFTDNGVGIIHATGPKTARLAAKYAPLIPQLRDFAGRADTPLDDEVKARIAGQLDNAERRFRDILGDD